MRSPVQCCSGIFPAHLKLRVNQPKACSVEPGLSAIPLNVILQKTDPLFFRIKP
jgi:hypothetical protein